MFKSIVEVKTELLKDPKHQELGQALLQTTKWYFNHLPQCNNRHPNPL